MKNRQNILFLITLISLLKLFLTQKVIKLQEETQLRYYDGTYYDTYDSEEFLQKIEGYNNYGFSVWFKTSSSISTEENVILHLTFLDNDFPWNQAAQATSKQHLSNAIRCHKFSNSIRCISSYLLGSTPNTKTIINHPLDFSDSDVDNQWHFLFVGVDHIKQAYAGVIFNGYSSNDITGKDYNIFTADASTHGPANEQLDERVKLHVGGSKGRTSGDNKNFVGYLADPIFYVGQYNYQDMKEEFYYLYGEKQKLYYFNVHQTNVKRIPDEYGSQNYLTNGVDDENTDAQEPTFSTTNGVQFATNSVLKFHMDTDFNKGHFLSFWMKFEGSNTGQTENVFEILNDADQNLFGMVCERPSSGAPIFKIKIYDMLGNQAADLKYYNIGTVLSPILVLPVWFHVYVSFNMNDFLEKPIGQIMLEGAVTYTVQLNDIPGLAFPTDRKAKLYYRFGQKIRTGSDRNALQANYRDFVGGVGGIVRLSSGLTDCKLAVGIESPFCLLCSTQNWLDGKCVAACPDGTLVDTNTRTCRKCHESCKTCTGYAENQCSTCNEEKPFMMDNYCVEQCPVGSKLDTVTKTCLCIDNCSTCSFNGNEVTCTSCTGNLIFKAIQRYECVDSELCDYSTFKSSSTCSSCLTHRDHISRACRSSCPAGTFKSPQGGSLYLCLQACPETTYADSSNVCVACSGNCRKCISATECTECSVGKLHETQTNAGPCQLTCQSGYVQDGLLCRICQENCTICPPTYFLHKEKCVVSCPTNEGYMAPSTGIECIENPVPQAIILKDPVINIGRRQDVLIQGAYIFLGEVSSLKWDLEGASQEERSNFFSKTFDNYLQLFIPYSNLRSQYVYTLSFEVTAQNGNSHKAQITINTSTEIAQGDFSIAPLQGIAGVTEFTINYGNWGVPANLKFDIHYGQNQKYTARNVEITQREKVVSIISKATQHPNEITYVFPPSAQGQQFEIVFKAYNDEEESIKTVNITLEAYQETAGSPIDFKSDVWWIKLQTGLTLNDYLKRSDYLQYLYKENQEYVVKRLSQVNILKERQNLKMMDSECEDDVQCRGSGQCKENFYDSSTYQCECIWNKKGQHCNWEERDLQSMQHVTYQILFNLQSFTYATEDDNLKLLRIITNIASIEDGLHKKSFRLLRHMINQLIQNISSEQLDVYTELFENVSNIFYQSITRPSLRPDEKKKYSTIFKKLLSDVLDKIRERFTKINQPILIENPYLSVFLLKSNGNQLFENEVNNSTHIAFPLKKSVVHIPKSILLFNETYTIQNIQYDFDAVHPQSYMLSTQIQIEIYDSSNKILPVSNLPKGSEIHLFLRKLNSYPPLREDINTFYKCSYLNQIDEDTFEWIQDDSMNFTFENEHFIQCTTTHLSHFGVQRGLLEFLSELPTQNTLDLYSNTLLNINLKSLKSIHYQIDQNIPLSQRPFKKFYFTDSKFSFNWDSPCAIIFYIASIIYLIISLIYLYIYKYRKNTIIIYSSKHQQDLMLSYHPLISVLLLGQSWFGHTWHMRVTKLFSVVLTYVAFVAVCFRRIMRIDVQIDVSDLVLASMFMGGLIAVGVNYIWEFVYNLLFKTVLKEERYQIVYALVYCCNIIAVGAYGIYENGLLNVQEYGNYVAAVIYGLLIDFFIFDILVVIYAYHVYESPFLEFLSFRGFFIRANQKKMQIPHELLIESSVIIDKKSNTDIDHENQLEIDDNEKQQNIFQQKQEEIPQEEPKEDRVEEV